jgi:hypothetical protein
MALKTHHDHRVWTAQPATDKKGFCPGHRVPHHCNQKTLERMCQKVTRSRGQQFCQCLDLVQVGGVV